MHQKHEMFVCYYYKHRCSNYSWCTLSTTIWESILKQLSEENVILMGDFNIDLLQPNTEFEVVIYSNNFIPIITLATHEKPGCKPSLIDNIFINISNNNQNAGIIESKISHHLPMFCFLNYYNPSDDKAITKCPRYDYCDTNAKNFISKLNTSLSEEFNVYSEATFIKFIERFKKYSDECFKVEEHCFKKSRRNYYVNPWVTPGIRACISESNTTINCGRKREN